MPKIIDLKIEARETPEVSLTVSQAPSIDSSVDSPTNISFIATGEKGSKGNSGSASIDDGSITSVKLAEGSVTQSKIEDNSISSSKLKSGAVTFSKIQNNAVTSEKIVDGAVTASKLSPGLVDSILIKDGAIEDDKYKDDSISEAKIKDYAITASKIANGHITHPKLAQDAIRTVAIQDGNVTESKLELSVRNNISNSKSVTDNITITAPADIDSIKAKVDSVEQNAQVNVQSNWDSTSGDSQILNKPNIPIVTNDLTNDLKFNYDAAFNHSVSHHSPDLTQDGTGTIHHNNVSTDTAVDGESLISRGGEAVWCSPESLQLQVRNDEGATLPIGTPVYSKGEIDGSNRIKVGKADASDPTKMPAIGITTSELNTSSGKDGFVRINGVYNFNITGFTGLQVNDSLYVAPGGGLTQIHPSGESNLIQNMGVVLKTNGSICQGLKVSSIDRSNAVPNLDEMQVFLGDSSNIPDSYEIIAGTNVSVVKDEVNKTLTFSSTDTDTTYTSSSGIRNSGNDFYLDVLFNAIFNSIKSTSGEFRSDGDVELHMDYNNDETGSKVKFIANNNSEVGSVDDKGNFQVDGIITGKQREIYNQSFLDDLGTTKHYLPFATQNEQTTIYQEEAAMIMPCDGKVVSVTVRTSSLTGTGNLTVGVHTVGPNTSQFTAGNWTEEETEILAVSSTDDYHVFHFAFGNSKHFESTELLSISIQADADLGGTTYWYVTTVVEYDWNNYLGTTSGEYDTSQ